MRSSVVCIAGAVVLAVVTGCGGPRPVPIGGTVTYKGKPVANAIVAFNGTGGAASQGKTDGEGNFSDMACQQGKGAMPGDYTVTIVDVGRPQKEGDTSYALPPPPPFPAKYQTIEGSDLKAKVEVSGTNKFTLELKD
jgi:hypothetical protein